MLRINNTIISIIVNGMNSTSTNNQLLCIVIIIIIVIVSIMIMIMIIIVIIIVIRKHWNLEAPDMQVIGTAQTHPTPSNRIK